MEQFLWYHWAVIIAAGLILARVLFPVVIWFLRVTALAVVYVVALIYVVIVDGIKMFRASWRLAWKKEKERANERL